MYYIITHLLLYYCRHGDTSSLRGHGDHQIYHPYSNRAALGNSRHGLYGSAAERLLRNNIMSSICTSSTNNILQINNPTFNKNATWRRAQAHQDEFMSFRRSWQDQIGSSSLMEANLPTHHGVFEKGTHQVSLKNNGSVATTNGRVVHHEAQNQLKRKTLDLDGDLDLNLSLKIRPKHDELDKGLDVGDDEEVVHSNLSLSLSSSSSSKLSRLKEGGDDHHQQDRKERRMMMASTLDLTL